MKKIMFAVPLMLFAGVCFADIVAQNVDGTYTVSTKKVTLKQLKQDLEVARALRRDINSKCDIEVAPVNAVIEQLRADIDAIKAIEKPIIVDGYIYDQ
jgi:hypothetical protein